MPADSNLPFASESVSVADLAELKRLRQENLNLSSQVNRLTWAERRMIESQDRLDQQIQFYRQLNRIGQQFHSCLTQLNSRQEIFRLALEFVIYELNFQRCLVLSYDADSHSYRAQQWDGYYEETQVLQLQQLRLAPDAIMLADDYLIVEADPRLSSHGLRELGQVLSIDEYFLFALQHNSEIPPLIIILGNALDAAKYHSRVKFDSELIVVLSNLVSQISAAINQASLYAQVHARAEELQQTLQDLQQAQTQLVQSEKMSALGNLVAGVAHEINNPMGFLLGNLQPAQNYVTDLFELLDLYQQYYPNPAAAIQEMIEAIDLDYLREDLPKLIQSMRVGVDRIRSISNSLRTFSRSDQTEKILFNIHEGIDSTLLILQHRLKATQQRPEIEVKTLYGNLPPVNCFPGQLNQVFMNLLANAIDALEDAHEKRAAQLQEQINRIEIQTQQIDDWAVISIRDNGIGMSEAVRERIFDHLFTTKAVGKGTGLGLAIAHQIVVETHSGQLDCFSQLGEGTEFQIRLPLG